MLRLFRFLVVFVVVAALLLGAVVLVLRLSLPQVRGRADVQGIGAEVTVLRDAHGVPHITASTREDAAFALGWVHAQDRLWQLEMQRRTGSGRLAEAFGPEAVERDRFLRTLGVHRAAERTLAELAPPARGTIEAYVAGINAQLEARRGPLPPEFLITGVRPEPFTPVDVVAWAKMMAWDLSGEYQQELLRTRLVARLGPERAAALFPAYPDDVPGAVARPPGAGDAPPPPASTPEEAIPEAPEGADEEPSSDDAAPGAAEDAEPEGTDDAPESEPEPEPDPETPSGGGTESADGESEANDGPNDGPEDEGTERPGTLRFAEGALAALAEVSPPPAIRGIGSNAFAVTGPRSASGAPLLANDPHLGLQAPSLFYLVHVVTPDGEVVGGSLPLTPAILLGRNERIAWGLTNLGSDDQDLVAERIDPDDPGRYLTPGGSEPFEVREETIRVRGADPVTITVRETRNGPVLSDLVGGDVAARLADDLEADGDRVVLALAWTALRPGDTTIEAALELPRATDWEQFRSVLERWVAPTQAVVYADVDGNIGLVAAGAVPRREAGDDGNLPRRGWEEGGAWSGVSDAETRPVAFNPPSGAVVAANQRVIAEDVEAFVTDDWTAPYRAERIDDLLGAASRHSSATFAAIQADVVSLAAREFAPLLTAAAPQTPLARDAQALLLGWNGRMEAGAPEPLIYAAWERQLLEEIFADELGDLFPAFRDARPLLLRAVFDAAGRAPGSASGVTSETATDAAADAASDAASDVATNAAANGDAGVSASPSATSDPTNDPSAWCDDVATAPVESCGRIAERALRDAVATLATAYGDDPARWRWGDAHPSVMDHTPLSQTVLRPLVEVRRPNDGDAFTVDAAPARSGQPFVNDHGAAYRAVYDLSEPLGAGSGVPSSRYLVAPGQSGNPLSLHYRNLAGRWFADDALPMVTDLDVARRGRTGTLTLVPAPLD